MESSDPGINYVLEAPRPAIMLAKLLESSQLGREDIFYMNKLAARIEDLASNYETYGECMLGILYEDLDDDSANLDEINKLAGIFVEIPEAQGWLREIYGYAREDLLAEANRHRQTRQA